MLKSGLPLSPASSGGARSGHVVAAQARHNLVKITGAHRMRPAQAAGLDSRCWEMSDMVAMIEPWEAAQDDKAKVLHT